MRCCEAAGRKPGRGEPQGSIGRRQTNQTVGGADCPKGQSPEVGLEHPVSDMKDSLYRLKRML
jgi:hypothetical protein